MPILKKGWKLRRNRPINCNAMLVRTMHPSNKQRAGLRAWQKITTRNKSITSKAMQYRQDIVTRMRIRRIELITNSTVTIWSIWHNSAAHFLRFGKFLPQICESCGATYRRNYETFSALKSTFSPLRAGCTNAQLTIWLANRGLTLTAQLTNSMRVARSTVN